MAKPTVARHAQKAALPAARRAIWVFRYRKIKLRASKTHANVTTDRRRQAKPVLQTTKPNAKHVTTGITCKTVLAF
jgi:hypothetical protein